MLFHVISLFWGSHSLQFKKSQTPFKSFLIVGLSNEFNASLMRIINPLYSNG